MNKAIISDILSQDQYKGLSMGARCLYCMINIAADPVGFISKADVSEQYAVAGGASTLNLMELLAAQLILEFANCYLITHYYVNNCNLERRITTYMSEYAHIMIGDDLTYERSTKIIYHDDVFFRSPEDMVAFAKNNYPQDKELAQSVAIKFSKKCKYNTPARLMSWVFNERSLTHKKESKKNIIQVSVLPNK